MGPSESPQRTVPPFPLPQTPLSVLKSKQKRCEESIFPPFLLQNTSVFVGQRTFSICPTMNTPAEVPIDTKPQTMQVENASDGGTITNTDDNKKYDGEVGLDDVRADGRDPSLHPDHPINALSNKRKWAILLTLSWAGFVANYSAAAHLTAFE